MLGDEEFRRLLDSFDRPWTGFRKVRKGVKKRVRRHMQALNCHSIDSYLKRLETMPEEKDKCEQCLAVTISRFFRDRQLWDYLKNRILPIFIKKESKELKAWSAGCANGEEPYSLALIWEEYFSTGIKIPNLQILASDAEETCLKRAKEGVYLESSLKEVPDIIKQRWFQKVQGKKQWRIDATLKNRISWKRHQLLDLPPSGPFDLIFLRNNLLTYYQGDKLKQALQGILETLQPQGVLIIGSHEKLSLENIPLQKDSTCPWVYYKQHLRPKIFQKIGSNRA